MGQGIVQHLHYLSAWPVLLVFHEGITMNARIILVAIAAVLFFLTYTFVVPALMSADSVACILLGVLLLVLPVAGAIIYFTKYL